MVTARLVWSSRVLRFSSTAPAADVRNRKTLITAKMILAFALDIDSSLEKKSVLQKPSQNLHADNF
jgi:hypothetical protein